MIAFSSDIDWAPEEVILDTLAIFESYQVKCTLFCTHDSKVLKNSNNDLFELAIHPNFNNCFTGKGIKAEDIIDEILAIYPASKGVRSHSLTQSSQLEYLFKKKGLIYDSNHFFPYGEDLSPFSLWHGIVKIPYIWEDDTHWLYGHSFEDSKIDLLLSGLKVFDFHPIHIFLNTDKQETYDNAKKHYHNPEKLLEMRNIENIGARDLLIKLLSYIKENKLNTYKLLDIASKFKDQGELL